MNWNSANFASDIKRNFIEIALHFCLDLDIVDDLIGWCLWESRNKVLEEGAESMNFMTIQSNYYRFWDFGILGNTPDKR